MDLDPLFPCSHRNDRYLLLYRGYIDIFCCFLYQGYQLGIMKIVVAHDQIHSPDAERFKSALMPSRSIETLSD